MTKSDQEKLIALARRVDILVKRRVIVDGEVLRLIKEVRPGLVGRAPRKPRAKHP